MNSKITYGWIVRFIKLLLDLFFPPDPPEEEPEEEEEEEKKKKEVRKNGKESRK